MTKEVMLVKLSCFYFLHTYLDKKDSWKLPSKVQQEVSHFVAVVVVLKVNGEALLY